MMKADNNVCSRGYDNYSFEPESQPVAGHSSKTKTASEQTVPAALGHVPFMQLFRYSSTADKWMMMAATLSAVAVGPLTTFLLILSGNLLTSFIKKQTDTNFSHVPCNNMDVTAKELNGTHLNFQLVYPLTDDGQSNTSSTKPLSEDLIIFSVTVTSVAVILIVLNFLFVTLFNITAENQVRRMRSLVLMSALKQDISWHDTKANEDFASRLTNDLSKIQEGIGEKLGIFLSFSSTALSGIVTALIYGWELTLVMISVMPILTIIMAVLSRMQSSLSTRELQVYSEAGSIAEEALTAIRTVVAFNGQAKEAERFEQSLLPAKKAGIKRGLATGIGIGLSWTVTYASYALAFWYGIQLMVDSCKSGKAYDAATLKIVFLSTLYAAVKFGQALSFFESFAVARGAASSVYQIVERTPSIDSSSTAGLRPDKLQGNIQFENVHFHYPSRPEMLVLNGMSLSVNFGQTVALVGSSGCGKSTCIQLLQRFYDPCHGRITIDGMEIKELNVRWLRDQIGVVGQEPVLFATSVGENIGHGLKNATHENIIRAAKLANAHDFIDQLPQKYDTMIGERGAQLSGGQKQRIAIARALIRDPKILLLDEATSALDTQSEAAVQQALEQARQGRTTIIVAHRLTTIRNADRIFVFENGVIKESGTHTELLARRKLYFTLVNSQNTEFQQSDLIDPPNEPEKYETSSEKVVSSLRKMEEDDTEPNFVSAARLLQFIRSEWHYMTMGCIGSAIAAFVIPAHAFVFGEIQGILSNNDTEQVIHQRNVLSILFVAIAVAAGLGNFLQNTMFSLAGEHLINQLRSTTFRAMLRQEIGWFDRQENSVGSLCARLSGDPSHVQGAFGTRIGNIVQILFLLTFSLSLAFYTNWKLALVSSVFAPLIITSALLQARIGMGQNKKQTRALEQSSNVAMESISNIRTVASLGLEDTFHSIYTKSLSSAHKDVIKHSMVRGLLYGVTVNVVTFAAMATYHYGGYLIESEHLHYKEVVKVAESMVFGMDMVGQILAYTPNIAKAKAAANRIFQLIDHKPTKSGPGKRLYGIEGKVQFQDVHFTYPTRRNMSILNGLSFIVKPGQIVALVGPSGCGKSTCIQLLQRFYDPDQGIICVDDCPTQTTNKSSLRSYLSTVSQEPTLFNRTIAENIAYGDNSRNVSMEEIVDVAKKANIHTFIQSLPMGYETIVGHRAIQLSGGQRQRVAIGRALVRNPKILLLDEATSALDSEIEKIVQDALDKAREGRTCIIIAHKLSTIQNADCIFVVDSGRVLEYGTHQELLRKQGLYYRLCNNINCAL